jgi:hypothetical protein
VVRFYSDIRILEGRAIVLSEDAGSTDPEVLKHEMGRHLIQLRQARRRAHFLIRRLRAQRPLFAGLVSCVRRKLRALSQA